MSQSQGRRSLLTLLLSLQRYPWIVCATGSCVQERSLGVAIAGQRRPITESHVVNKSDAQPEHIATNQQRARLIRKDRNVAAGALASRWASHLIRL